MDGGVNEDECLVRGDVCLMNGEDEWLEVVDGW